MNLTTRILLTILALFTVIPLAKGAESTFPLEISGLPEGYKVTGAKVKNGKILVTVGPSAEAETADASATDAAATTNPHVLGSSSGGAAKAAEAALEDVNLDLAIDSVPAFLALDLTPETVDHPTTPREFAAALINGTDRHGVLQNGFAMEFAPFRTFGILQTNHVKYADPSSYLTRALYNSSLSVATSKAAEDKNEVQLAVGLSTILYESKNRDAYRNDRLLQVVRELQPPKLVSGPDEVGEENQENISTLEEELAAFKEQQWEGTVWSAAVVPVWESGDGSLSNLKSQGFSAWTTIGYGFKGDISGSKIQLLGQLRYRADELISDSEDENRTTEQDSLIAAARLRIGKPDFNAFVEGGYVRIWDGLEGDGNAWRAAGGIEKRVSKNVWLVLSAGQQFGESSADDNEFFATGSLRIGANQTSTLTDSDD